MPMAPPDPAGPDPQEGDPGFPPGSSAAPDPRGALRRLSALAASAAGFSDAAVVVTTTGGPLRLSGLRLRRRTARVLTGWVEEVRRRRAVVAVADLAHVEPADRPPGLLPTAGAFLGVPVWDRQGEVAAVLAAVGPAPRPIRREQIATLEQFAAVVADHLDLLARAGLGVDPAPEGPAPAELRAAITSGQVVPYYQPIVDLQSGDVVAFETLARWPSRTPGEEPAGFVVDAERSDLVVELDRAIARRALADLRGWLPVRPDLQVSLNVSGRSVDRPDWVAWTVAAVESAGVPATAVTWELTETVRPKDPVASGEAIQQLRRRGFSVWFDDFGTGWSALHDLVQHPVDGIKIDRSFAEELGQPVDDAVVRAISTAAAELGLIVTMEGVETADQAIRARDLGCHRGQGYLWSPALPAAEVPRWLGTGLSRPPGWPARPGAAARSEQ